MGQNADSEHHIVPRSRVPDNRDEDHENTVTVTTNWHEAFHRVFRNLRPRECHVLLHIINNSPGEEFDGGRMYRLIESIKDGDYAHLEEEYVTYDPIPKEEQE